MIVDLLIGFFRVIVAALDLLLPDWTPLDLDPLLDSIEEHGSVIFGLFRWLNWYAPVNELLVIGGLGLSLFAAALIYRGAMKLARTLHLFGGG